MRNFCTVNWDHCGVEPIAVYLTQLVDRGDNRFFNEDLMDNSDWEYLPLIVQ